jgi:hypothetical protein
VTEHAPVKTWQDKHTDQEEEKVILLFTSDIITHVENSKDSIKKILIELKHEIGKVTVHKRIKKSIILPVSGNGYVNTKSKKCNILQNHSKKETCRYKSYKANGGCLCQNYKMILKKPKQIQISDKTCDVHSLEISKNKCALTHV